MASFENRRRAQVYGPDRTTVIVDGHPHNPYHVQTVAFALLSFPVLLPRLTRILQHNSVERPVVMKPRSPLVPGQAFSPPAAPIRPEEGSYRRHHHYVQRHESNSEQDLDPAMEESPKRDMHNYNFSRPKPLPLDEARQVTHLPDPYRFVEPDQKEGKRRSRVSLLFRPFPSWSSHMVAL